jgi:hypothetical protein
MNRPLDIQRGKEMHTGCSEDTLRKGSLRIPSHTWKDNIKIYIKRTGGHGLD